MLGVLGFTNYSKAGRAQPNGTASVKSRKHPCPVATAAAGEGIKRTVFFPTG